MKPVKLFEPRYRDEDYMPTFECHLGSDAILNVYTDIEIRVRFIVWLDIADNTERMIREANKIV